MKFYMCLDNNEIDKNKIKKLIEQNSCFTAYEYIDYRFYIELKTETIIDFNFLNSLLPIMLENAKNEKDWNFYLFQDGEFEFIKNITDEEMSELVKRYDDSVIRLSRGSEVRYFIEGKPVYHERL